MDVQAAAILILTLTGLDANSVPSAATSGFLPDPAATTLGGRPRSRISHEGSPPRRARGVLRGRGCPDSRGPSAWCSPTGRWSASQHGWVEPVLPRCPVDAQAVAMRLALRGTDGDADLADPMVVDAVEEFAGHGEPRHVPLVVDAEPLPAERHRIADRPPVADPDDVVLAVETDRAKEAELRASAVANRVEVDGDGAGLDRRTVAKVAVVGLDRDPLAGVVDMDGADVEATAYVSPDVGEIGLRRTGRCGHGCGEGD